MSITVVCGTNWGDEGKGRMVDYLAREADIVVRYQGGNNAGHTIVNDFGTFKLHLVPSGIFYPHTKNVLGPGMVIDLESLVEEIDLLTRSGFDTSNISISHRATICFPFNRQEDIWEEERLGKNAYGSTRKGIAPAYGDRYVKKAIQVGDVCDWPRFKRRLAEILDWKHLVHDRAGHSEDAFNYEALLEWANHFGNKLRNRIRDTTEQLESALAGGKRILFESQLGALRDIYFGIYPHTTSSCTLASFAPVGGGLFSATPDKVIGVMKAFSTCVGEGPFPTEITGRAADELRETANEFGATTGRPRRIGHFDAVASAYGAMLQNATEIALTKLDSLSGQEELLICTEYESEGSATGFPLNFTNVRPVYTRLPGWIEDISECRRFADLPETAQTYVKRIESLVDRPILSVSVGPHREQLILRS